MTTTFFLVRHAAHALLGRVLAGRSPGVHIDEAGRIQAEQVARRLADERISVIEAGPQPRTRETAAPIAARVGLPVGIELALDEVDVGEWTGRTFHELEADPRWRTWNKARGSAGAPGGETMGEVQARIVCHLDRVRGKHPEGRVVMVSHGDVIKAAIVFYLGLTLDALSRFEISPAGLSTLVIGDWGSKIITLNEVPAG